MRSYREGSVSHHGKEASLARGEQIWKEVVRNAVWCLVRILTRLCRTGQGVRNLFKSKVKTFNVFKLIICPPILRALEERLMAALWRTYHMARVGAAALFQAE